MELLLVEDDPGLSELIREKMDDLGLSLKQTYSGKEALEWLEQNKPDLMLLDYSLPDMVAPDFIMELEKRNLPRIHFIVTTGRGDENIAVSMMKLGARDYIVKDGLFLDRLPSLVQRNIRDLNNIRKRKRAEEELRKSQEDLSITLESIGDGIIVVDQDLRITRINPMAASLLDQDQANALQKDIGEVLFLRYEDSGKALQNPIREVIQRGEPMVVDQPLILSSQESNEILISLSVSPLKDHNQSVRGAVLVLRDISEIIQLQEKLQQSQKLDAIGRLAGGVAHDFNNMLSGILNAADLMADYLQEDQEYHSILNMLISSAENAAELTRKLLSFGKKRRVAMTLVDLHEIIDETLEILKRTLNRRVVMKKNLLAEQSSFKGDGPLIENVLINLALNASHAMPDGGTLSFKTANREISKKMSFSMEFDLKPGQYISLEVEDSGTGMSSEVMEHIFEPFYSTKNKENSSGLGLATSYGTVLQHNGAIWVESTLGRGSKFSILLPCRTGSDVNG